MSSSDQFLVYTVAQTKRLGILKEGYGPRNSPPT